jgi:hypothetical protein
MYIYEIHKMTMGDTTVQTTHMVSEATPCMMVKQLLAEGNDVKPFTAGDKSIYVNWTEDPMSCDTDGYCISLHYPIDADKNGLFAAIRDDRIAAETSSLDSFLVSCTRTVTERYNVRVEAPDVYAAKEAALEMCSNPDMDAEWDRDEFTTPEKVDSVDMAVPSNAVCHRCSKQMLKSDGIFLDGNCYHGSCYQEEVNS